MEPPTTSSKADANVATRSRRIVYLMADLGETLSTLSTASGITLDGTEFVGITRGGLDWSGWWTPAAIEPITRHVLLSLTKDDFLRRCSLLYQFVGEGLAQKPLRELALALGVPANDMEGFKSLKLLDLTVRVARASEQSGLPVNTGAALIDQVDKEAASPVDRLFALNELRQLSDHLSSVSKAELDSVLAKFKIKASDYGSSWGQAVDAIYDGVGDALAEIVGALSTAG